MCFRATSPMNCENRLIHETCSIEQLDGFEIDLHQHLGSLPCASNIVEELEDIEVELKSIFQHNDVFNCDGVLDAFWVICLIKLILVAGAIGPDVGMVGCCNDHISETPWFLSTHHNRMLRGEHPGQLLIG